jgi:flagellar biosynthesis regulator FlbT
MAIADNAALTINSPFFKCVAKTCLSMRPSRIIVLLASLLIGTAGCAQSQSIAEHPNEDMIPITPVMQTDTANDPLRKKQFLTNIRQLMTQSSLSAEKVTATFGWPVVNKQQFREDEGGATLIDYDAFPLAQKNNASLGMIKNERRLSIQLNNKYVCIRSKDVLSEFGRVFKRIVANVEGWPDENTLSEEVKMNLKMFFMGPIYQFNSPEAKIILSFDFGFFECLNLIDFTETAAEGTK